MVRELIKNVIRLRRDESGVALMLTMSVILLLYVLCSGVYAIGETVREKIELQEACDSAAYSAAVVQADGLSRMAMINRALSWSYVQLTNMQLEFITHKWLKLVCKRFKEDSDRCERHAGESDCLNLGGCGDCDDWFKKGGNGWFCGVYGLSDLIGVSGHEKISLNGSVHKYSEIAKAVAGAESVVATYEEYIPQMKETITFLNGLFDIVNMQMGVSIKDTVIATLYANLPKNIDGEIDGDLAQEFLFRLWYNVGSSPYPSETDLAGNDIVQVNSGYFSPLFNTEAGERQFLSMADGAVHEDLFSYFKAGSEEVPGGLDQWFIRSYAEETAADAEVVAINPVKSLSNYGICRVYKNANRQLSANDRAIKRGHHTGISLPILSSLLDTPPSCDNDPEHNVGQCDWIDKSVALYADYEWAATSHKCFCYRRLSGSKRHRPRHLWPTGFNHPIGIGNLLLYDDECGHHFDTTLFSLRDSSHSRSSYGRRSCLVDGKTYAAHVAMLGVSCNSKSIFKFLPPYGFARIYGDDQELYDAYSDYYVGAIAKPWVLNERFFGEDGAIVVALARKQRNPWQRLLGGVLGDKDGAMTSGIYSAFSPAGSGNRLVAFSASRAAYHFHPSKMAVDKYDVKDGAAREFETRYDAVTDNVEIDGPLSGQGVGCVCGRENAKRYARCWNLCETDWDATLLPVRFAYEGTSSLYDSAASGAPNVNWTATANVNVFREAAADKYNENGVIVGWAPLVDENGKFIGEKIVDYVQGGSFLRAVLATDARVSGFSGYKEIYGESDIGDGELRAYEWAPSPNDEKFMIESDQAFQQRIL